MSTLVLTRGLPASGKTTWARAWVAEAPERRGRVNRDDLRHQLFGAFRGLTLAQEAAVTEASRASVLALLGTGRDVVADDMNLRPKYVREWRRFVTSHGHTLETVELPIDVETAIERDAQRERQVGAEAIRSIAGKFTRRGVLLPIPDDVAEDVPEVDIYTPPARAELAVIVDIDGTLALHNGRSPYDLHLCGKDLPNPPVVMAVEHARAGGARIIFCSGREDSARADTEEWLDIHVDRTDDEPLLMRAADDKRRDSIVKRELFDQHIRERYDVAYVLDDRNQVVQMWRSLGLTVLQVAEGDF